MSNNRYDKGEKRTPKYEGGEQQKTRLYFWVFFLLTLSAVFGYFFFGSMSNVDTAAETKTPDSEQKKQEHITPTKPTLEETKEDTNVVLPENIVDMGESDIMYIGVLNPIPITVQGYDPEKIKVACSGCSINLSEYGYVTKVSSGEKATIHVMLIKDDGGAEKIAKKEYAIKKIPDPLPYFAGKSIDDETLKISHARSASLLKTKLNDFPLDVKFKIVSFNLTLVVNEEKVTLKNMGNRLTSEAKRALKRIKLNDEFSFTNIRAKGPDGSTRRLKEMHFKAS
jgi:hypothetical protein